MGRAKHAIRNEVQHATNIMEQAQPNPAPQGPPPMVLQNPFAAPPPTQIYYAPPVQVVQAPTPTPPTPLGQVFAQQNRPNQPAPNNQQGQGRNNQPQGGGQ